MSRKYYNCKGKCNECPINLYESGPNYLEIRDNMAEAGCPKAIYQQECDWEAEMESEEIL